MLDSNAMVVPHEVIAMQQGIAADLQGDVRSLCEAGTSCCESLWCTITAAANAAFPE